MPTRIENSAIAATTGNQEDCCFGNAYGDKVPNQPEQQPWYVVGYPDTGSILVDATRHFRIIRTVTIFPPDLQKFVNEINTHLKNKHPGETELRQDCETCRTHIEQINSLFQV